jgi:outer membrane protein assembly factor BamB
MREESDMTNVPTAEPSGRKPLRLWPGVAIVVLQWVVKFVVPLVVPEGQVIGMFGGLVGALAVVVWWVFFSRASRLERWGALPLMALAVVATRPLMHESIQNGMMGMMFVLYAVPATLSLALVLWAVTCGGLAVRPRRAAMVAALLAGCGVWGLVRTNGIAGDGGADLEWRWTPTAEERLLATAAPAPAAGQTPIGQQVDLPPAVAETLEATLVPAAEPPVARPLPAPAAPVAAQSSGVEPVPAGPVAEEPMAAGTTASGPVAEWPGFRGPRRDSVIRGVRIATDWAQSPPVELWRRPIGPGWSSFAVRGDRLYTQEQRGEDEIVSAYDLTTGAPVWMHGDATRFWESNGGAGPRATPTLSGGRVFTMGATGILNALEADDGAVVWSRNVAADSDVEVPGWGFAASPLVVGDLVIAAASGALVGYDLTSGERRWLVPSRGGSYSSPHLLTIDGVEQVVLMGGHGATSVAPADGTVLWDYEWQGVPIVQPAVVSEGEILISSADAMGAMGLRRLTVSHGADGWAVEEGWTSRGLKPYFNDFVVHEGHAFGFDGFILSCIDLADGARQWKGGRYGNGQLVLLPDEDLLLVLSEKGELALVQADAAGFKELARFPAIAGKTWNHPVLAGDLLLVRNGEEMAAFRLSLVGG